MNKPSIEQQLKAEIERLQTMCSNREEFIAQHNLWKEFSTYLSEPPRELLPGEAEADAWVASLPEPTWNWQPWETAPKNRAVLIRGIWRPYDILPGGSAFYAVAMWSSIMSDGVSGYQWYTGLSPLSSYNVDITHWCDIIPVECPPAATAVSPD